MAASQLCEHWSPESGDAISKMLSSRRVRTSITKVVSNKWRLLAEGSHKVRQTDAGISIEWGFHRQVIKETELNRKGRNK